MLQYLKVILVMQFENFFCKSNSKSLYRFQINEMQICTILYLNCIYFFLHLLILRGGAGCGCLWNLLICWSSSLHKRVPRFSFCDESQKIVFIGSRKKNNCQCSYLWLWSYQRRTLELSYVDCYKKKGSKSNRIHPTHIWKKHLQTL